MFVVCSLFFKVKRGLCSAHAVPVYYLLIRDNLLLRVAAPVFRTVSVAHLLEEVFHLTKHVLATLLLSIALLLLSLGDPSKLAEPGVDIVEVYLQAIGGVSYCALARPELSPVGTYSSVDCDTTSFIFLVLSLVLEQTYDFVESLLHLPLLVFLAVVQHSCNVGLLYRLGEVLVLLRLSTTVLHLVLTTASSSFVN